MLQGFSQTIPKMPTIRIKDALRACNHLKASAGKDPLSSSPKWLVSGFEFLVVYWLEATLSFLLCEHFQHGTCFNKACKSRSYIYLFGCAGSKLRPTGASIFLAAYGIIWFWHARS